MPARRVLYLTAHQLAAFVWNGGQLREEASFQPTEAVSDFVDYLQRNRRSLFTLVVNVAEEGFQVDTIPYLQARDRDAVIERKLGQLFQGAPLTVAVSLGFEKTRRRDERLLFAALNNNTLFAPWLTGLKSGEARLAGIYSLPLLASSLVERMQLPKVRSLLVSVQDTSIRQSFFDRGQICFSRLSPLANSSIVGISQAIASEAAKTQQYLLSQRQIARTDALAVHVLIHPQAVPAVTATCIGSDTLQFQIHNLHDVAHKVGLKSLPEDSRADALYLHAAVGMPPKAQFAKEPMQHEYRLWQFANALRAAGAVVFAGCALFVAKEAIGILELRDKAEIATSSATMADQRYRSIASTFPQLAVGNDSLRLITGKYAELERLAISPAALYLEISRAMGNSPQIELSAIDWSLQGVPKTTRDGNRTAPGAAPTPTAGGASTTEVGETAVLRGRIEQDSSTNPRELLRVFDAFVAELRSNPKLDVTIQQQPFDFGAEKALKSSEGRDAKAAQRPFTVTIARKLPA